MSYSQRNPAGQRFIDYVIRNYDSVKHTVQQGENIYNLRNLAAEHGAELTPQETIDCLDVMRIALEIIESENYEM